MPATTGAGAWRSSSLIALLLPLRLGMPSRCRRSRIELGCSGWPARRPGNSSLLVGLVAVVRFDRDVVADNLGERAGDWYWRISESDEHLVTVVDDVVDGEPNDPAQWLGVQQNQQGDEPLGQVHIGAGMDPADQGYPLVLADRFWRRRDEGWEVEFGGVPASHGPQ